MCMRHALVPHRPRPIQLKEHPRSMPTQPVTARPHVRASAARLLSCAALLALLLARPCLSSLQSEEEKLGRQYAAEVEKRVKLVQGESAERVARIGRALAEIACAVEIPARYGSSEVCRFDYRFKVIEDSDINAFSLPGGHIYVNSGLLDFVGSDDELAGVLAHEIAHAAHHHMTSLLRRQSSIDKYIALVALAGILGNMPGRDLNNLLMGAQITRVGKLSGYTLEAEQDADRTAVAILAKSSYDPGGLLSFMRKLEQRHQQNPTLPLGIYQTHPAPHRRVAAIIRAMQDEGIPVDLRQAMDLACARTEPVDGGSGRWRVLIKDRVVFEPASLGSGVTSKERADEITKRINAALDSRFRPGDVRVDALQGTLLIRGVEMIRVEPEDAADPNSVRLVLDTARAAIEYAAWSDWVCGMLTADRGSKPDE